jgi:hypothetical protein
MKTAGRLVLAGLILVISYLLCANAVAFVISFVFAFIYRTEIGPTSSLPVHSGKDPYIATASVLIGIALSTFATHKIYRYLWQKSSN